MTAVINPPFLIWYFYSRKTPKMKFFKNVLIALDLTKMDDTILDYANILFKAMQPENVYCYHVSPIPELPRDINTKVFKDFLSDRAEMLLSDIQEVEKRHLGKKTEFNIEFIVDQGSPFEELLKFSKEKNIDLIIVGKKKIAGGSGILASKLARKSNCSVLFVTENAKPEINKILIPVDFSENSAEAVKRAFDLNVAMKEPEIIIQNVYEVPAALAFQIGRTPEQFDSIIKKNIDEAYNNFISHMRHRPSNLKAEYTDNVMDNPAKHIEDYAERNNIDLIMIGSRGHSTLERLFLGSVTEKLLAYNNSIPVLIIRKK